MSQFSRILLIAATVAAFFYLMYSKGLPAQPTPNPGALTDVVLQPFLAVLWGLVGYLFNAVVFACTVTFAVKIARKLVEFVIYPERAAETAREIHAHSKEGAQ